MYRGLHLYAASRLRFSFRWIVGECLKHIYSLCASNSTSNFSCPRVNSITMNPDLSDDEPTLENMFAFMKNMKKDMDDMKKDMDDMKKDMKKDMDDMKKEIKKEMKMEIERSLAPLYKELATTKDSVLTLRNRYVDQHGHDAFPQSWHQAFTCLESETETN